MAQCPELGLGLIEKADTRSRLEVGETNLSSLVVKSKPSSQSKDALTQNSEKGLKN